MRAFSRTLVLSCLSLSPGFAQAEGNYVGVDLSLPTVEDSAGDSVSPKNIGLRLGHHFNENIGIELQGQFTVLEDEISDVDFSAEILGLYLTAGAPVSDAVTLYVLGGLSNVELGAEFGGVSASADDETGPSYGVGIDYRLNSERSFTFRYMQYLEEESALYDDVSGFTAGISWRF